MSQGEQGFGIYLSTEAFQTSTPVDELQFFGHSYHHTLRGRDLLEAALPAYPRIEVQKAEMADFARVHTREYLDALQSRANGHPAKLPKPMGAECTGLEHCLPGYLHGLGALMGAVDRMKAGTLERAYFKMLGGHHSYADWGHGYSPLNPLAAAARYAQTQGFGRVLIVDWDHHHGDGTQSIFAHDPTVHCLSIHSAADLYMAKMDVMMAGTFEAGAAVGHQNVPLLDARFSDKMARSLGLGTYYRAAQSYEAFRAALENIPWSPDILFVFSGYDSHRDDCGFGVTNWVDEDYAWLTERVLEVARRASCPVLSVNGGGYNLRINIPAAVRHVEVLARG